MSMRFTEIGQQLRAYRLESGLRAEEIAARLGVSRAALYRYEKGEVIKLDTIKRLAELLKISPLSLLGIGVEYYNRPIGYFERIRQVEETADQILQLFGPDLLPDDVRCLRQRAGRGVRRGGRAGDGRTRGDAVDGGTGAGHPDGAQADVCHAAARDHRHGVDFLGAAAAGDRRGRRHPGLRPGPADLPRRGGDRGREHGRADGGRADGPAVRPADRTRSRPRRSRSFARATG